METGNNKLTALSYQIVPNIIFIFSVLGVLLIILRRLPEAAATRDEALAQPGAEKALIAKGLPAQAISRVKVTITTTVKKIWNFILEAKDLKPYAATGYRIKKIFGGKLPLSLFSKPFGGPQTLHEVKNEQYYLDTIKLQPKNLTHYDALGKFYLDGENINDARDIYQYLVNHQPSSPDYQARLAYCFYQIKNFDKAAEHYQKSIALDSTQPNRYYNLGLSLEAAGRPEEAAAALKKALELEPQNEKYLQALGKIEKK